MCDLEALSELDRLILGDLVNDAIDGSETGPNSPETHNLMRIWHVLVPDGFKPRQ